jgi:hypothetical protein
MNTPFWQRTLDSFADEVIARAYYVPVDDEGRGGYYAAILRTPKYDLCDPDFRSYGDTAAQAQAACAKKIRAAAKDGRYERVLQPGRYDFHFRLCKHWVEIEEQLAKEGWERWQLYVT